MEGSETNYICIESNISEKEFLNLLNRIDGLSCESADYLTDDCDFFLTFIGDYAASFKISIMLTWNENCGKCINSLNLSHYLAVNLQARVLVESYQLVDSTTEYVMFDKQGSLYSVEVTDIYVENEYEGMEVIENSLSQIEYSSNKDIVIEKIVVAQ